MDGLCGGAQPHTLVCAGPSCTLVLNDKTLWAQRKRRSGTLLIVTHSKEDILQHDLPYRHIFNLNFHITIFTLIICDTFYFLFSAVYFLLV